MVFWIFLPGNSLWPRFGWLSDPFKGEVASIYGDKKGHGLNDLVGVFFPHRFLILKSFFFVAKMPRSWCGRYQRTHGKRSSFWEHFTAIFGPRWCGSRPMKWEEMWFENSGGPGDSSRIFYPTPWLELHVFTSKRVKFPPSQSKVTNRIIAAGVIFSVKFFFWGELFVSLKDGLRENQWTSPPIFFSNPKSQASLGSR